MFALLLIYDFPKFFFSLNTVRLHISFLIETSVNQLLDIKKCVKNVHHNDFR